MINVVFTVGLLLGGCGMAATFMICHSYMQKRAKTQENSLQKEMNQTSFIKEKNEWEEMMSDKLIERLLSQEQNIKDMEEEIRILRISNRLNEVEAEEKRKCQISNLKEEWSEKRNKWEEERLRLIREKEALSQKLISAEKNKPMRSRTKTMENSVSLKLEEKIKDAEKERRDERNTWEQERLQLVRKEETLTQMFLSAEKRNEDVKQKMETTEDKLLRMEEEMNDIEEKRREERNKWEEERVQLFREKEAFLQRFLDAEKDTKSKIKTTVDTEMKSVQLQNKWTNNAMRLGDKWEEQRLQLIKEMGALVPTFLSAAQKIKAMEEEEHWPSTPALDLTLNPNTANENLAPSESNGKVTKENQSYPHHPDRSHYFEQVLCTEGLTGHCYWEVVWSGWVSIAVAYRGCSDCLLGNNKSWSLECKYGLHHNSYTVCHNGKRTVLSARPSDSNRVGVYLDWPAGILSFNRISPVSVTHLYTIYYKFTEPLYPGFWFGFDSSVSLCQMKEVLWS